MYVPAAVNASATATRNITWPSRNVELASRSAARGSKTLRPVAFDEVVVANGLSDDICDSPQSLCKLGSNATLAQSSRRDSPNVSAETGATGAQRFALSRPAPARAILRRTAVAGRTRSPAESPGPTCSSAILAASAKAMSMPADTPAAVTCLPSNTTRSGTASTPSPRSSSSASQWLVARLPSSRPAAASTSEPVQTEVVHVLRSSAARSQSCTGPSSISASRPGPPGTSTTSGCSSSVSEASAVSASWPVSVRLGPACSATNVTVAPGRRLSTS